VSLDCTACDWKMTDLSDPAAALTLFCPECQGPLAYPAPVTRQLDQTTLQATAMTSEATSMAGQAFGPYEIISEVARGGMGVVYKARHREMDRIVALKVLLGGTATRTLEEKRFLQEIRLVSALQHPHIISIYDSGVQEQQRYFTMEYIEGGTLNELTGPTAHKLRVMVSICQALQHAHLHGVIHRDLKPTNVLIDQSGVPRVVDFGLATQVDNEQMKLTATGNFVGTPYYMSPEQVDSEVRDIDLRTDVFSLGVLLYELLTGSRPFQDNVLFGLFGKIVECRPPAMRPGVPQELQLITAKAMARDREARYQSAEQLAGDLQAYLDGRPISARGPALSYRLGKWVKRHQQLSALFCALLLCLVLGLWYYQRLPATVTIWTGDEAASVYIDDRLIGQTEAGQPLRFELPAGQHKLRVQNPRSFPAHQPLPLRPNQQREFTVLLRRKTGRLMVATTPAGASVRIEGSSRVLIDSTPDFAELERGSYRIVVSRDRYRPITREVKIGSGGALTRLKLTLEREAVGTLAITSQQDKLTLEIWPQQRGLPLLTRYSIPFGDGRFPLLEAGSYRLCLSKSGYLPAWRRVTIRAGERLSLRINLAPISLWRRDLPLPVASSIFVGDLDRSGRMNLLGVTRGGGMFCLERHETGTGWRILWERSGQFFGGALRDGILVDLDGNGALDWVSTLPNRKGHTIVALSCVNGAILWTRAHDSPSIPAAADLDGDGAVEVVLDAGKGRLIVLDGRTGALRQRFTVGAGRLGSATLADVTGDGRPEILVPGQDGAIHVIDPRSGKSLASHAIGVDSQSPLAIGDISGNRSAEVVTLAGGALVSLSPLSGRIHWRVRLDKMLAGSPMLADLGRKAGRLDVLLTGLDGKLRALSGKTGRPLWAAVSVGALPNPAAVGDWDGDGAADITTVTRNGRVTVVSGASGKRLWQYDLQAKIPGSPALADLDGDGVAEVYLATTDGRLYGIAPQLDLAWWRQRPGRVTGQYQSGDALVLLDASGALTWYGLSDGQPRRTLATRAARALHSTPLGLLLLGGRRLELRRAGDGELIWQRKFDRILELGSQVGDLDGDQQPELVLITRDAKGNAQARALHLSDGTALWVRPLPKGEKWQIPPVIGDLHGRGQQSVLIAGGHGSLTALRGTDGRRLWSVKGLQPRRLFPFLVAPPAVADIDGDGAPDVIQPSGFQLHRLRGRDGQALPGKPLQLPAWNRGPPQVLRDSAGRARLVMRTERSVTAYALPGLRVLWDHHRLDESQPDYPAPCFRDLNGDGLPDVLFGTNDGRIVALDGADGGPLWQSATGHLLTASPQVVGQPGKWIALLPLDNKQLHAVRLRLGRAGPYWPGPRPGGGAAGNLRAAKRHLQYESALQRLLPSLTRTPGASSYHAIAAALKQTRQARGLDAWRSHARAMQQYYLPRGTARAIEILTQVLAREPRYFRQRLARAEHYLSAGQNEAAIRDLSRILADRGSRCWDAYILRGVARLRTRQYREAVLDLCAAEAYPTSNRRSIYNWRATGYMALKDYTRALVDLDRLIALHPGHTQGYLRRARARESAGQFRDALADYTHAGKRGVPNKQVAQVRQAILRLRKKLAKD